MTQGRAQGQDRAYQVHCRDLLQHRNPGFAPYSGDGIDVPFDVGGTTWTMDVALKDSSGALLVAECRRRKASAKQEEVAAFAYKVELLRRDLGAGVCGAFLTKRAPQLGGVKVGQFEGITVAALLEGNSAEEFSVAFHRYDVDREKRIRDFLLKVTLATTA